ncbi:hypothetical protein GDO81_025536 [Engystomops pustulosus]|uniref:UPAR/Ly6 domain-containing protein n=2 Tax=Engystomops pustulosus TaxID=76066 RepID=A0AAV6ZAR4_ENGPU|nr:hypothetical protein GDO81_025536 [Engystomops pustulosus]
MKTMSSCLLVTCLLSAIAATGYSLSCIECTTLGDTICNGTSKLCPSGDDSCISSYIVTYMGGMEISKMYIRQCGKRAMCSKSGSISLPNGRIKAGTTCCRTNDCAPSHPVLPGESTKKNGLSCKTCFSTNLKTCDSDLLTDCIGNETMCIYQVTTRTGDVSSTTAVQGCATKDMCQPARQLWNLGKMIVNVENTCSRSGIHVQPALILLILSFCFFWKSLC